MTKQDKPQSLNGYSQVSVAIVALLLGFLLVALLHSNTIDRYLKELVNVVVSVDDNQPDVRDRVEAYLGTNDCVNIAKTKYISKSEAFAEMLPGQQAPTDNPFSDIILVGLKAECYQGTKVAQLQAELGEIAGVNEVLYKEQDFGLIKRNTNRLLTVFALISGILFVIALFFVIYSIRYSLAKDSQMIHDMYAYREKKSAIWIPLRSSTLNKAIISLAVANAIGIVTIVAAIVIVPDIGQYISIFKVILAFVLTDILLLVAILVTSFMELTRYLEHNFNKH